MSKNLIKETFKAEKLSRKEWVRFMSRFLLISIPLLFISMFVHPYLWVSLYCIFIGVLIIVNLKRLKDTGRDTTNMFVFYVLVWPLLIAHTIIFFFSDFKKTTQKKDTN